MASITLLFVGLGVGFSFGWIGSEFWCKRAIKKAFKDNIGTLSVTRRNRNDKKTTF